MEKKYYFRGLGLGIIVTAVIMGIAMSGGRQRSMTDEEIIARAKELGMTEDSTLLESAEEAGESEGSAADDSDAAENSSAKASETAASGQTEKETVKPPVKKDVAVAEQAAENSSAKVSETAVASGAKASGTAASEQAEAGSQTKPADTKPADGKPEDTKTQTKQTADTNEMTKPDEDTDSAPAKTGSVTIVSGDGSYTVARKLAEAGLVGSAADFDTLLCERGYDKKLRTGTFQIPAGASEEQIARIVTGQE